MTYNNYSNVRKGFWCAAALSIGAIFVTGCNPFSDPGQPGDAGADRVAPGAGGNGGGGSAGQNGGGGNTTPGTGGRGGAAGAGAGGSGGAAGAGGNTGTGGATGMPSCTNGRRDGTETGVDCGGTACPGCPTYKINAPARSDTAPASACGGGTGYMCARQMLLSPEFKQAALDDWASDDPPFVYAVAGHDLDAGGLDPNNGNACCQCYQLIFESPIGATGLPIPKPMIVQTFNTAAGGGHNFDIYMAAGGFGANNACTGGSNPMYSTYPDLGGNFTGGVRASRYGQCAVNNQWTQSSIAATTCQTYVGSQCALIQSTTSPTNQSTSQDSCTQSNYANSHYHINWNVRAMRVECPVNLTRVTGCKLNGQGLPQANPAAKDVATATSGFRTGYGTTTMQDCCRPTCAYPSNVANADPTWSVYYTCDRSGAAM